MKRGVVDQSRDLLGEDHLVLVDLGSRGGFETDFQEIAPLVDAYGFEPDPEAFAQLPKEASIWRSATNLPYAVGAEDGPATLYIPASPEGASLRPHNEAMIPIYGYANLHRDVKTVPIHTRTLDSLRAEGKLPRVDMLKVDIEGIDLEMLAAAKATLADTLYVKVEGSFLEQRIGQATVWPLAAFLVEQQFRIIELHDIHRWRRRSLPAHPYVARHDPPYSRGEIAQVDLIAVRDPVTLTSADALIRLALILGAAGYFDSAATALAQRADLFDGGDQRQAVASTLLRKWSRDRGRTVGGAELRAAFRRLVPLLRSRFGGVPAATPELPY